jgi:hypothetical protein
MIRNLLIASTCSATLALGATAAIGAVAWPEEAKAPLTGHELHAPLQLAQATGEEAGATGTTGEESATGATEGEQPSTGAATATGEAPASGTTATEAGQAVEPAAGAATEEGTGGANCQQAHGATGKAPDTASDAQC